MKRARETRAYPARCPKCNLGGMTESESKRHRCSSLLRSTAAERDARIVAEAGPWDVLDIGDEELVVEPSLPFDGVVSQEHHTAKWKGAVEAAARILNRLARKRRG